MGYNGTFHYIHIITLIQFCVFVEKPILYASISLSKKKIVAKLVLNIIQAFHFRSSKNVTDTDERIM